MSTTKQVKRVPNPTGKGGFQERPEDRSDGRWDKTQSISYQYNKLMRMTPEDLSQFKPKTVAQDIAKSRIEAARDKKFGLPDSKEITDRTEGKAPQSMDITSGGEKLRGATIVFADEPTSDPTSNRSTELS